MSEEPDLTKCSCESCGWCPILRRRMMGRSFQICNGRGDLPEWMDEKAREEYRRMWMDMSNGKLSTNPEHVPPPIHVRIGSFMKAIADWLLAGRPVRSKEEQNICHAICESCPWFSPKQDMCTACGCNLSRQGWAWQWGRFLKVSNAIKMATKHCSKGKW